KRHGGRYGRGESRRRAGSSPGSQLECREISERWRRLSRRCRHAVHRGYQESWSRCMCASGQAFVNAEAYSYQGVRRGEDSPSRWLESQGRQVDMWEQMISERRAVDLSQELTRQAAAGLGHQGDTEKLTPMALGPNR